MIKSLECHESNKLIATKVYRKYCHVSDVDMVEGKRSVLTVFILFVSYSTCPLPCFASRRILKRTDDVKSHGVFCCHVYWHDPCLMNSKNIFQYPGGVVPYMYMQNQDTASKVGAQIYTTNKRFQLPRRPLLGVSVAALTRKLFVKRLHCSKEK